MSYSLTIQISLCYSGCITGQFEVNHSSDLAEALTAGLVETSLEDMRQAITISDWHLLGSLKVPRGQTLNPFIFFAIFPDTIKIPQNNWEKLAIWAICDNITIENRLTAVTHLELANFFWKENAQKFNMLNTSLANQVTTAKPPRLPSC